MKQKLFSFALPLLFLFPWSQPIGLISPLPEKPPEQILAQHSLSLNDRLPGEFGNEIFRENILLNIKYFNAEIILNPGETFAFHDQLLPQYKNQTAIKTGWTHFSAKEGYQSLAGLMANGVCHLASLMNWTSQEAGLEVFAPTRHDFFPINGIPKEYGTAIYYHPSGGWRTLNQNLYITNPLLYPVKLIFQTDEEQVLLKIVPQPKV